jgi:hypothetical protein
MGSKASAIPLSPARSIRRQQRPRRRAKGSTYAASERVTILARLAAAESVESIVEAYPGIEREDGAGESRLRPSSKRRLIEKKLKKSVGIE